MWSRWPQARVLPRRGDADRDGASVPRSRGTRSAAESIHRGACRTGSDARRRGDTVRELVPHAPGDQEGKSGYLTGQYQVVDGGDTAQ